MTPSAKYIWRKSTSGVIEEESLITSIVKAREGSSGRWRISKKRSVGQNTLYVWQMVGQVAEFIAQIAHRCSDLKKA